MLYTKTGDGGTTSNYVGERLSKADWQIEACGDLDELNSFIGLVISNKKLKKNHIMLLKLIQKDLYLIMAHLSRAKTNLDSLNQQIIEFEKEINIQEKKLPPIKNFILPQGKTLSCLFQILRTVCRRAERSVVRYYQKKQHNVFILKYLNRLSDLFFILARCYNKNSEEYLKN
jgi:cob(I)alamin adenosyltransferase